MFCNKINNGEKCLWILVKYFLVDQDVLFHKVNICVIAWCNRGSCLKLADVCSYDKQISNE